MKLKLSYIFLTIIIETLTVVNGDDIQIVEKLQNLNTLKILKELKSIESSTNCLKDIKEYVDNLMSNKLWALKMYDSSAQGPTGLLLQNKWFLGQFDECIEAMHPQGNFAGQHCLLNVHINLKNHSIFPKIYTYQPKEEFTSELKILYGICLPSTCSPLELNETLNMIFEYMFLEDALSVTVDKEKCQTKALLPGFTCGDWAVVGFFVFFVVIALMSTWYDAHQSHITRNKKPHPLLASFSILQNGRQLFGTSRTSDQLAVLDGIRTLSIIWVILIHGYSLMMYFSPVVDRAGLSKRTIDYNHVITTNGYLAVDSFLFLSGLLVCFVFFRDIAKKGYYDFPMAYINRYIRLTPPYAVVMLLTATIFPYLGTGPIWRRLTFPDSDSCKKLWWVGLLYVQNYVSPYKQCLSQSWYLAVDMQLYWISPLILYPLFLWPFMAPVFLTVVILAATFTTFAIAYLNDLGPSIDFTNKVEQIGLEYKPFHTRAAPWLVGVALGYVICTIRNKKIRIKLCKFWILIGWLISLSLCFGSLYGIVRFIHSEYSTLEAAFYLAFHRLGWALGLVWIVFACAHGYGGPINSFLSSRVFQPLGKLTYCSYLIHLKFQYYRISVSRVNIHGDDYEAAYAIIGDTVLTFLASIPLTLLFEMPFRNMSAYFFQRVTILPLPMEKKKHNKGKEIEFDFDVAPCSSKQMEKEKFLE